MNNPAKDEPLNAAECDPRSPHSGVIPVGEKENMKRDSTRFVRILRSLADGLAIHAAYFAGFVILIVSGLISYAVVGRYFLNEPVGWSNEVSEYALFFTTFLATALVMKEEAHIAVDILATNLPNRPRRYLKIASILLSMAACLLGVVFGASLVWKEFTSKIMTIGILRFERWWLLAVVPLAFLSMLLILIRQFTATLSSKSSPGKPSA